MRWRERLVMTSGARYAVVFLFVLNLAVGGAEYAAAISYYHAGQASLQRQAAAAAAAQRRQARQVEHKLCMSFGKLAALKPPPGNPADNPSRAYLQNQHDILAGVGPDIGCKEGRGR